MCFPFYKQREDEMDCGPTCLRMVAKYYGKSYSIQHLSQLSNSTNKGSSLLGISEAAEKIGFRTIGVKVTFNKLCKDAPLPCIAHWNKSHYVVIYKIKKSKILNPLPKEEIICIADPARGLLKYSKKDFLKSWKDTANKGILLLLTI